MKNLAIYAIVFLNILSLTLAFLPTMVNHVQHEQLCTTRSTSTTHTSIVAIPSHSVFLMPDL
jgi:hypothetical protein